MILYILSILSTAFNGSGSTAFLHDFYEQNTLVDAVESFSLRCTAVSSLNSTAAMWLHAEPKPATHVQLPGNTHPLCCFKQTHVS